MMLNGYNPVKDEIHDMIHKLINVLNDADPKIGASAMMYLLITNRHSQSDKIAFLGEMSNAWDYYQEQDV